MTEVLSVRAATLSLTPPFFPGGEETQRWVT